MKESSSITHTNRMGQVYYLQEGKTSTGKPKYYMGRKTSGTPLQALPAGYEIHERPENGQVLVRKIKSSPIELSERETAIEIVRRASGLSHFLVEIERDALVVYTPGIGRGQASRIVEDLSGMRFQSRSGEFVENIVLQSHYHKMLRFELVDEIKRLFFAQRWCFRGSIDDWFPLGGGVGTLPELVAKYAKHLDRESFYELF